MRSSSQLQALAKAHVSLIRDYKYAEWGLQDPNDALHASAAPAAALVPLDTTTLLMIPPLNQLAQMVIRAPLENGEILRKDAALGCQINGVSQG
jgi:hypothetical protein